MLLNGANMFVQGALDIVNRLITARGASVVQVLVFGRMAERNTTSRTWSVLPPTTIIDDGLLHPAGFRFLRNDSPVAGWALFNLASVLSHHDPNRAVVKSWWDKLLGLKSFERFRNHQKFSTFWRGAIGEDDDEEDEDLPNAGIFTSASTDPACEL